MNILVCIKQVPNTEELKVDAGANSSNLDSVPLVVNSFDTYALETAVKLKDADASVKIVALTLGAEKARDALKSCLSVGTDKAYLVCDEAFAGSDTLATSYALSKAVKVIEEREGAAFDIIFCGKQANDGDTAQVGPQLAEYLDYPQLTYAREVEIDGGNVKARRETEDGYMVTSAAMPVVVTVTKTLYEPRYASVKSKMAANRAEIPVLTSADLGLDASKIGLGGSPTKVRDTYVPQRKTGGVKIEEDEAEIAAEKLTALLSDAAVI